MDCLERIWIPSGFYKDNLTFLQSSKPFFNGTGWWLPIEKYPDAVSEIIFFEGPGIVRKQSVHYHGNELSDDGNLKGTMRDT